MPSTVYTSRAMFADQGCSVLVIACSSHAFMPPLREFLTEGLRLGEGSWDLLAVPGGPQFLMLSEYLPKFAWAGQKWIRFFVDKKNVTRVILVSHEDCGWYHDERLMPAFLQRLTHGTKSIKDHQLDDLKETATYLRGILPQLVVEAYYIEKTSEGKLQFTREV